MADLEYKRKINNILKREKSSFAVFLQDGDFSFSLSEEAQAFDFKPLEKKLIIPIKRLEKLDLTEDEILSKIYIQLGNAFFIQRETAGLRKRLLEIEKEAEIMFGFIGRHFFPGESADEEVIIQYVEKEIYRLYNVFDILTTMLLMEEKFPYFRTPEAKFPFITLWQKEGLISKKERQSHLEYIYGLLPLLVLGQEGFSSYPRIYDLQNRMRLGRTVEEFIIEFFSPVLGQVPSVEKRDRLIKGFFYSQYAGLWEEDLESFMRSADKEYTDGEESTIPREQMRKEMEDRLEDDNMSFMDPETLKDLLNQMLSNPHSMEISMDERKEISQQMEMEETDSEFKIERVVREDYNEIMEELKPLRREMREVWKSVLGESMTEKKRLFTAQKRGNLDVDEIVRSYPQFVEAQRSGKDSLPIYQRFEKTFETAIRPDQIEVTILMDNSGSMDPIKIYYAKRALMTMLTSLKDFGEYLHRYRKDLNKLCKLYFQVLYFGTEFQEILPMTNSLRSKNREVKWMNLITSLDGSYGHTHDEVVLKYLREGISSLDRKRIASEKLLKMIFVITDGASNELEDTKEELNKLAQMGVHLFGFQMGQLLDSELERFQEIWNMDSLGQEGIVLGEELDTLPKRLLESFSDIIRGNFSKNIG